MNYHTMLIPAAMTVWLTACGAAPPKQVSEPAALPPTGPDGVYQVQFPEPKPAEDRMIRLTLSTDASVECQFSPHFAYNAVEPLPQDRIALRELAQCLNRPEVRPHGVVLMGRTDVQGPSDYNAWLGRARANRVRELLIGEGVDGDRIRIASRGEHDAKGFHRRYSHGFDRRVDVMLDGPGHSPDARPSASNQVRTPGEKLRNARREVAFEAGQDRFNARRAAALIAARR
jgi:outer membrane protein OmpA-like peptidoglycan-associated protein